MTQKPIEGKDKAGGEGKKAKDAAIAKKWRKDFDDHHITEEIKKAETLPAMQRRKQKNLEKEELEYTTVNKAERNQSKAVAEKHGLPQHLIRMFMEMGLVSASGNSVTDHHCLFFVTKLRRSRKFARWLLVNFSTTERRNLMDTAGLNDLETFIHGLFTRHALSEALSNKEGRDKKKMTRLYHNEVLVTLLQERGIRPSKQVNDAIIKVRKLFHNQLAYKRKVDSDALGTEEHFLKEQAAMEALTAQNRNKTKPLPAPIPPDEPA